MNYDVYKLLKEHLQWGKNPLTVSEIWNELRTISLMYYGVPIPLRSGDLTMIGIGLKRNKYHWRHVIDEKRTNDDSDWVKTKKVWYVSFADAPWVKNGKYHTREEATEVLKTLNENI